MMSYLYEVSSLVIIVRLHPCKSLVFSLYSVFFVGMIWPHTKSKKCLWYSCPCAQIHAYDRKSICQQVENIHEEVDNYFWGKPLEKIPLSFLMQGR